MRWWFFLGVLLVVGCASAQSFDMGCYAECKGKCALHVDSCLKLCVAKCGDGISVLTVVQLVNQTGFERSSASLCVDWSGRQVSCPVQATSCDEVCGFSASTAQGFDVGVYQRCVRAKCRPDCEGSCEERFGRDIAKMRSCLVKECKRDISPAPCVQACAEARVSCERKKSVDITAGNCAGDEEKCFAGCNPPIPGCQTRCRAAYKADDKRLLECLASECNRPQCPAVSACVGNCANTFFSCVKSDNAGCAQAVASCLGACNS